MTDMTFQGFTAPSENWTRLPNALIDALPLIDTLAEMKVILYTLRHTWGFQEYKAGQQLTIDEYMHGKKVKDDERADAGTGMSKPSIMAGINKAIEHGFIDVKKTGRLRCFRPKMQIVKGKDSLPQEKIHKPSEGKETLPNGERNFTELGKETLPKHPASIPMTTDSGDSLKKEKEIERKNIPEPPPETPKEKTPVLSLVEKPAEPPKPKSEYQLKFDVMCRLYVPPGKPIGNLGGQVGRMLGFIAEVKPNYDEQDVCDFVNWFKGNPQAANYRDEKLIRPIVAQWYEQKPLRPTFNKQPNGTEKITWSK